MDKPKAGADFPRQVLLVLLDQVKQADAKALGTFGALAILMGALATRITSLGGTDALNTPWLLILGSGAVLILLALKSLISVVYPRDAKTTVKDMLYFKSISNIPQADFINWGKELTTEDALEELYRSAHNLAKIAESKYAALRKAMIATGFALAVTIVALVLS